MRNMYEPAEVYGAFVELILLGFVPKVMKYVYSGVGTYILRR